MEVFSVAKEKNKSVPFLPTFSAAIHLERSASQ
jgi:hypothetical protein